MASFVKASQLESALNLSPIVRALQQNATVDVVAMLMALADVESSYQLDAAGDGGSSFGLWQINSKVWTFDPTRIGSLDYQLSAMQPVFEQANDAVQKALAVLRQRQDASGGLDTTSWQTREASAVAKRPPPSIEQPLWYSIVWQFGAGSFAQFIAATKDTSAEGFSAYRKSIGKPVPATFYKRQTRMLETYDLYKVPDRASFWNDVVVKSGSDLLELPGKVVKEIPWGTIAFGAALALALWSTARRQVTG